MSLAPGMTSKIPNHAGTAVVTDAADAPGSAHLRRRVRPSSGPAGRSRQRRGPIALLVATAVSGLASCGATSDSPRAAPGAGGEPRLAAVLPDRDALALVDPVRGTTSEVPVGASPWGVAVAGSRAFVSTARHVAVVDVRRRRVVRRVRYRTRIPVVARGEDRPGGMGIAAAPDGRRVFVGVHTGGRGVLEVLDTRRLRMTASARIGVRPFDVLAGPGGRTAFTVDHDSYGVTAVDTRDATTRTFAVAPLGRGAFDKLNYGALDARSRLLLPINGEVLAILDPVTGRVVERPMSSRVHQAGVTRSGSRLLTVGAEALEGSGGPNLSVFDLRSGRERVIPLRRAHEDIAVSGDGRTAYLSGGYTRGGWRGLTVVSLPGGRTREVSLAAAPLGIALLPRPLPSRRKPATRRASIVP